MSFDTKLLRYCDHKVSEDEYCVEDTDFKTVTISSIVANPDSMIVRVDGVPLNRNNTTELLFTEDVTSQITGSNTIYVASKIPIYDGSNRKILASRPYDVIVQVTITDEDASAQFTGIDTLLVTQHRPLMSKYDIYATQLTKNDITVKVNSVIVDIDSIEPIFGKIILKNAPVAGAIVTVSYIYRAHVKNVDATTGRITIKEVIPTNQTVAIFYYPLFKDGWQLTFDNTFGVSKIIFDQQKQTNQFLIQDEDVSNQFTGIENYFYTQHKPIIPPKAKIRTDPNATMITQVAVLVNGQRITPVNMDAITGEINLGFVPKITDTVTISYNYRDENVPTDIISLDYQVTILKCRKCRRTGQVNDYDYDKLHDVITVVKEQKMLQDLLKLVTAIKGTNTAHPWYGTSLISYIGTAKPSEYYIPKFKGEIIDAGEKMKDLQTQQTQYQQVDDEEFFSFLSNIIVEQSDIDPDFYDIDATVVSQAATAIQLDTSLMFNKPLFQGN